MALEEEIRLIRKIQASGNRAAADLLVRKYFDEIYAYVCKQTSDKHTAMNLVQNIFVSMLQSIGGFRCKASFRTWLYRIATNKTIDYFRSQKRRKCMCFASTIWTFGRNRIYEKDGRKGLGVQSAVLRSIVEMSLQQIFRLKFFGEYTFSEIGAFDMPESTVKSKYYRLLKLLREEFKNEYD